MTEQIGTSNLLRTWANDGTVVTPANAKIDEGWLRGEQPPHEWMNYIHNVLGQKVNHALSRGAADWNSGTEYLAGATVNHDGDLWLALATNTNSTPSSANSNWSGLFSRANILGTVSQSAGVPTDAIIERGSNSNGEFVRFADGTQFAVFSDPGTISVDITEIINGAYRSARQSRDFPVAFSDAYPVVGGVSVSIPGNFGTWIDGGATSTEWVFRALRNESGTGIVIGRVIAWAIGRWF